VAPRPEFLRRPDFVGEEVRGFGRDDVGFGCEPAAVFAGDIFAEDRDGLAAVEIVFEGVELGKESGIEG
jgi:hypothetical protein